MVCRTVVERGCGANRGAAAVQSSFHLERKSFWVSSGFSLHVSVLVVECLGGAGFSVQPVVECVWLVVSGGGERGFRL